ncbi:MAG: hypothetical protein COA96_16420 [SAR86 cluster bacterium]|uniref:Uncharacterized protein n=1 Tax=SAR86 cluster bacterium TaxID=2030880 RepID=A0A2A5AJV9_9GAMM|nr:MAG: hypothetical protein COA96_16420 [SAR86 cluster bacterium]
MIFKEKWRAHRDSNPGQTDYEAMQPVVVSLSKPKSRNEFSFTELLSLTETEPLLNLLGVRLFTELGKWKNLNGFH